MRLATAMSMFVLLAMFASAQSDVNTRGDQAMGFAHTKTAHHFLLRENGGIIQVEANDGADESSGSSIKRHLAHIAKAFSAGDFQIPMLVHDKTPPGAELMKRKKEVIQYRYVELPNGGRVVISSSDPSAIGAIHEFLRFQIKDHGTGDPLTVPN